MYKKIFVLCILALLLLSACVRDNENTAAYEPDELYSSIDEPTYIRELRAREELLELGWTEYLLDSMIGGGITFENMANQVRFSGYVDKIYRGQPIGPSGEVIAPRYYGGIYFNENGVPVVKVLSGAFDHAPSVAAIEEMQEMGILVRLTDFTDRELGAAMNRLSSMRDSLRELGIPSMWIKNCVNRLVIDLDPYTDERIENFWEFLRDNSFNTGMFFVKPAITQEMRDARAERVAAVTQLSNEYVVPTGDIIVSRTGVQFTLKNRSHLRFLCGSRYELALYADGNWLPVPTSPGVGNPPWTDDIRVDLYPGGTWPTRYEWSWRFGELPPGRYMVIQEGWFEERNGSSWSNRDTVYVFMEFTVEKDSPVYLPPMCFAPQPSIINLVEYSNVNPAGIRIIIENISAYDIDHRAKTMAIVPDEHTHAMHYSCWMRHGLPFLSDTFKHHIQGEGLLSSGGTLEFNIDWTGVFGALQPGEYVILISTGGRVHQPHPTGWAFGNTLIVRFTVN